MSAATPSLPQVTFPDSGREQTFTTRVRFESQPNLKHVRKELAEFYQRLGYDIEPCRKTQDYLFGFGLGQRKKKHLQFLVFFIPVSELEYDIESVVIH